jgi:opacity protein-like surface antigen
VYKLASTTSFIAVAALLALFPSAAAAQQNVPPAVQQAEREVESAFRRFGIGIQGGVALDPELLDVGVHATFGPIFNPSVAFRPGLELALGEVTTMFGINLDVLYVLPGTAANSRWQPYVGAGPNFSYSRVDFEPEDDDEDGNRFDFSDSDGNAGFNFIAGARNANGLFLELKATAYGVSTIRLLAGFDF